MALDPAPDRDVALGELAHQYLTAYEPATPDDFYSWSGLYKRDIRTGGEAIEDELLKESGGLGPSLVYRYIVRLWAAR